MDVYYSPTISPELIQRVQEGWEEVENSTVRLIGDGYYLNCLDVMLHTCRAEGLFKRKLVLPASDQDVVLRMLLQAANKQLTGDSSHPRSELLELQSRITRLRKEGRWPEKGKETTVELAAGLYQVSWDTSFPLFSPGERGGGRDIKNFIETFKDFYSNI